MLITRHIDQGHQKMNQRFKQALNFKIQTKRFVYYHYLTYKLDFIIIKRLDSIILHRKYKTNFHITI